MKEDRIRGYNSMSVVRRLFYTVGMWIRETGQAMDRAGCRLQGNYAFTEQCELDILLLE